MTDLARLIKPIHKSRVSAEIIQQMKSFITKRNLKPGEKLPSERELSLMFSVGRPMVREALRSLEIIGLIEVRQGKGAFIKEVDFSSYIETLKENASLAVLSDSISLEEFYEGRKLIEPAIARVVAETRNSENLEKLEKLIDDTHRALKDGGLFIKYSAIFHEEMARMTHNKLVQFSMDFILTISPRARRQKFSQMDFREMVLKDHKRIVARVREKDGKGASHEMERHLDNLIRGRAIDP